MRRLLAAALVLAVPAATADLAAAAETGTVRGRVFDVTCYGPCTPDPEPQPFAGEGAVVVARRSASGEVAKRIPVQRSRFSARLKPGRYELTVKVPEEYWESDSARVRVLRGEVVRAELHVSNSLVL